MYTRDFNVTGDCISFFSVYKIIYIYLKEEDMISPSFSFNFYKYKDYINYIKFYTIIEIILVVKKNNPYSSPQTLFKFYRHCRGVKQRY